MDSKNRFALLNTVDTLSYPYNGVFISPVRLHYKNLQHDSPVVGYTLDYKLKGARITKPYIRASQEIVSLEFLPYTP